MTISAVSEKWLIAAAVVGTAAVFQVRQWVRRAQARMRRRRDLFQVLIVTSAEKMSADHVRALNMIDLEFDGIRAFGQHVQSNLEKRVCERWHTYRDHLNRRAPVGDSALRQWAQNGDELLVSLLVTMSASLGEDFTAEQIGRWVRMPRERPDAELSVRQIRDRFSDVVRAGRVAAHDIADEVAEPEMVARQMSIQKHFLSEAGGGHLMGTETQPRFEAVPKDPWDTPRSI